MGTDVVIAIATVVGAYLVGGVPFAYLVSRVFYRTDIREEGSGNVGATNVYRVFGVWPAALVFALDVAKGYGPVALAGAVGPEAWGDWLLIAAAMAAVLGHTFTPYLRLSGGKGVATAAGALLRLTPISLALLLVAFAAIIVLTRMVSLGSTLAAAAYPLTVLVFYSDRPVLLGFAVIAAALVVWRHRANIRRIAAGTEGRLSWLPHGRDRSGGGGDDVA